MRIRDITARVPGLAPAVGPLGVDLLVALLVQAAMTMGDLRVRVRCRDSWSGRSFLAGRDSCSGRGSLSSRGSPTRGRSVVRLPRAGEPFSLRQTPGRGIRPGGPVNRMESVSS